ncbi:hypothetical protein ULF88_20255 [Halopseudomonas pachastrellae]|nr:hypothetical protein [Halopseudomonas pachastrellae]
MHPHTMPHSVDGRWLLALYLIIPLSLVAVLVDLMLFDRYWQQQWLPDDPNDWAVWALLFGLPHIVASAITVAKPTYIRHFWRRLLPALLVFCVISLLGLLGPQPPELSGAVRVLCRFYGVSRAVAAAGYWAGAGRATPGCAVSALEVDGDCLRPGYLPERIRPAVSWAGADCRVDLYQLLGLAGALLCGGLALLTWQLARLTEGRLGRAYLWANALLLLSALVIDRLGYTLFVILMPRLIHDLTAYSVYVTTIATAIRVTSPGGSTAGCHGPSGCRCCGYHCVRWPSPGR